LSGASAASLVIIFANTPPIPHPDQVKINMNTGLAHIEGPATKEQVAQVEMWRDRQKDFRQELE